uniref:Uncharacterized protein n=1 Tax=Knipowitschia caucasica TaxID=637954 RepID=A0AAV2LIQ7_KNICA
METNNLTQFQSSPAEDTRLQFLCQPGGRSAPLSPSLSSSLLLYLSPSLLFPSLSSLSSLPSPLPCSFSFLLSSFPSLLSSSSLSFFLFLALSSSSFSLPLSSSLLFALSSILLSSSPLSLLFLLSFSYPPLPLSS